MGWACSTMDEERGVDMVLLGEPEGRRPLGRPRRRCVDNIRLDLQEVGRGYMDWIGLAQDRDRWRTLVSPLILLLLTTFIIYYIFIIFIIFFHKLNWA